MTNVVRTPTLAELKTAGYTIDINHNRVSRVAYMDAVTGKIVNTIVTGKPLTPEVGKASEVLYELLPKGGVTEVTVTDSTTKLSFFASSRCRDDENYSKREGVRKCLERIAGLMLVIEWKGDDNFKSRLQC